ncbi:MAG: translocation/assembly module TamB [Elusimicrobiota bacterium]|jgi:hypothetical protein|nr:translocation/assembly module TamB [Elusimicrobiota bacterium]
MKNNKKTLKYIVVFLAISLIVYIIANAVIARYIEKSINSIDAGVKISAKEVILSPFKSSLLIKRINIDDKVFLEDVFIKIKILKLFKNIRAPLEYIRQISIMDAEIAFDENYSSPRETIKTVLNNIFTEQEITILLNRLSFAGHPNIALYNSSLILSKNEIIFSSEPEIFGFNMKSLYRLSQKQNDLLDSALILSANDDLQMYISLKGTINKESLALNHNIIIESLGYKDFKAAKSEGYIISGAKDLNFSLYGDFGSLILTSKDLEEFILNASVNASKINANMNADLKINYSYKNSLAKFSIYSPRMALYSMDFGSLSVNASKDAQRNYKISYKYGLNDEARIEIKENNIFDLKLFVRGSRSGGVYIDRNLEIIKADIANVKVMDFPLNPFYKDKPQGIITILGSMDKDNGGLISFNVSRFKTASISAISVFGSLTMEDGEYLLKIYDDWNFISLNAAIKNLTVLFADFKFNSVKLSRTALAFRYNPNFLTGFASGAVVYNRDKSLNFDMKISSGVFYYDNRFSEWIIKGSASGKKIDLQQFTLKNLKQESIADISGLIDWTDKAKSNAQIKINKLKIKDFVLSSDILFTGKTQLNNQIKGNLKNSSIQINGMTFPSIQSDIIFSKKRISFFDIESDNSLQADIEYDIENDFLSSRLQFKNADISGAYKGLSSGLLTASADISGKMQNYKISLEGSLRRGMYMKVPFSSEFKGSFNNNETVIDKFDIISGGAKFSAKGKYSKLNAVEFSFENITKDLIDKFIDIKIPVQGGKFSGGGILSNTYSGDNVKMVVKGSNTVVSNIKIDNFTSDINISKNIVSIGSVSIKYSNAEIKSQNAQIDLKSGQYFLNLELINTNIVPLNIFGKAAISGKIDGDMYLGSVVLSNFWINKYKINAFEARYKINGSSITVISDDSKNKVHLNTFALIDSKSRIVVRNFHWEHLNAAINANAVFDRNDFTVNLRGSNIDIDIIGDILNSPIEVSGNGNLFFKSSGTFANPTINLSLNVYNGSIALVPFDYANFVIDVHQNIASIKTVQIVKRNEMNLSISGEAPFWLSDSVKTEMMKKPVNIKYDFSDSKSSVLKYLSDDFIAPKSGRILLNGNIKGSLNEISNNGRLIISGGVFDFQNYLSRAKDIEIDIALKDNYIVINKFFAKSSGGTLIITGGLNLDSFAIRELNLRARTENGGIPLTIPQLSIPSTIISDVILKDVSKAEPFFDISIIGSAAAPKISGTIILENARFNYPPSNDDLSNFDFIPPNAQFEIDLLTGKNTNFENAIVNARIGGGVKFRGTASNLEIQGEINTQRGTLSYLGAAFNIVAGRVEIVNNRVYISGEGKTEVFASGGKNPDEVTLTITRSDVERLNLNFTSKDNPSMDSRTVIAKVLGIKVDDASSQSENASKESNPEQTNWTGLTDFEIRQQAVRLINSNFVVPLAKTLLRRTGIIDNLKVSYVDTTAASAAGRAASDSSESGENPESNDPSAITDENSYTLANFLYGTKYTVEKNITNQMALGYSLLFDQLNNELDLRHGLELTYRLTNSLFLTGNYELQSENIMRQPDRRIMIRHQVKFGGNNPNQNTNTDADKTRN